MFKETYTNTSRQWSRSRMETCAQRTWQRLMMEMESIQRSQTEGNLMLTDHNTLLQQFIRMFSLIITWVFLRGFVLFWARISCCRSDGHQIHNLPTSDPKLLEFHLCTATIMLNLEFSHNKGKSWNTENFALNLTPSPSAMKFYGSKHLLHILSQPQIIIHVKVINCDIRKNVLNDLKGSLQVYVLVCSRDRYLIKIPGEN